MTVRRVVFVWLFVWLFLVVPNSVCAQSGPLELEWSEMYEDYLGVVMIQTLDGGFLLAGTNTTSPQQHLTLIKTSHIGEIEWSKNYPDISWVPALVRLTDSGYLIVQDVGSAGYQVELLRVDFQGNIEWSYKHSLIYITYHSQDVRDVFFAVDNNSFMLVTFDAYRGGYSSQFECYDMDGVRLWSKAFTQSCIDVVLQCGDGGFFVAGSQDKQLWFAKLDSMGEVVWSNTYGYVSSIEWPRFGQLFWLVMGFFVLWC